MKIKNSLNATWILCWIEWTTTFFKICIYMQVKESFERRRSGYFTVCEKEIVCLPPNWLKTGKIPRSKTRKGLKKQGFAKKKVWINTKCMVMQKLRAQIFILFTNAWTLGRNWNSNSCKHQRTWKKIWWSNGVRTPPKHLTNIFGHDLCRNANPALCKLMIENYMYFIF